VAAQGAKIAHARAEVVEYLDATMEIAGTPV